MPLFPQIIAVLAMLAFCADAASILKVGNEALSRDLSVEGGILRTVRLTNSLNGTSIQVPEAEEFSLTLSVPGAAAVRLTTTDFEVGGSAFSTEESTQELRVTLEKAGLPVALQIRYWAKQGEAWMRKELRVTAKRDLVIEGMEVERLAVTEAYEPYHANQLTARGAAQWRPPLGQPVYTRQSAAWWGVEFPAARNRATNGLLTCGYLTHLELKAGQSVTSHPVAFGVAEDGAFVKEAFFEYIDATRARPLRLQTQYNSWFDYGQGVSAQKFLQSVKKVDQELMRQRGVPPLRAYVIDDGWQDSQADWPKTGVWKVNEKFDPTFAECQAAVAEANSHLGLWLSPSCLFGAEKAIGRMREAGWRTLDPWMSLSGEAYMAALEQRMVWLASHGVCFFKLDGIFGHLNKRNFDIAGFRGGEPELNEARFDEQKERYLSLGAERLLQIFKRLGIVNPDIYIVISNGAFLSPWWLQSIDAVWMINAGDAAGGLDRSAELVYRDQRYYQLASDTRDNTQYPLHSLFNHEPKKTSTGESAEEFAHYLHMSLARGTGFVELYLKTARLSESDWNVLAGGLKWAHRIFPAFKHARMIGGEPDKKEVYGYTGWTEDLGYLALHNPGDTEATFSFQLDRKAGLTKSALARGTNFQLSSPLAGDSDGLPSRIPSGGRLTLRLPAKSVRILEFSRP